MQTLVEEFWEEFCGEANPVKCVAILDKLDWKSITYISITAYVQNKMTEEPLLRERRSYIQQYAEIIDGEMMFVTFPLFTSLTISKGTESEEDHCN